MTLSYPVFQSSKILKNNHPLAPFSKYLPVPF